MSAVRSESHEPGPHTSDDGLFGRDSVSWRAMAHPSTGIGAAAAAMIQMLYPPVMYVVDQASTVREKPELRARRTGEYATTITYGDIESAEKAGATLRRIHAKCHAVHPDTGETIAADEPHLLVWVNNSLTWSLLGSWTTYGLELSAQDRDRFVVEQRIAARLVGCDPESVAGSVAELDAYMASMEPKLAKSAPCVWFKDLMGAAPDDGGVPAALTKRLMVQASVALMSDHHRKLYGYAWGPLRRRVVVGATRALLGPAAEKLPLGAAVVQLREHVDDHAFGARRTR